MASPADDIYEALVNRFKERGLESYFNGGLLVGEDVPGVNFPYAIMDPVAEGPLLFTNRSEYDAATVQVRVYDKTFTKAKAGGKVVRAALRFAPLPLRSAGTVHCKPGSITYQKEDAFWRSTVEFEIVTGYAR